MPNGEQRNRPQGHGDDGLPLSAPAKQSILVTGATGYLASALCGAISQAYWNVLRGGRIALSTQEVNWLAYGDLGQKPLVNGLLAGIDIVVHFAGKAHVEPTTKAIATARISNVEGTRYLVEASAEAGVRRFIFISSALVLEGSIDDAGWINDDCIPNPKSVYGQLKSEAEEIVRDVSEAAGMEWVIVRPPMVYGPRSPGNLKRLIQLVATGLPLPLASAAAPKSFVFVDNLISALKILLDHPAVGNQTLLVADNEALSTAELIRTIAACNGQSPRLFPFPQKLLRAIAGLANRSSDIDRLFKPLALNASRIKTLTGWEPPYTAQEGLVATLQKN